MNIFFWVRAKNISFTLVWPTCFPPVVFLFFPFISSCRHPFSSHSHPLFQPLPLFVSFLSLYLFPCLCLCSSDLVAPSLQAPLLVETWIRGSKIPSSCPSSGFRSVFIFVSNDALIHIIVLCFAFSCAACFLSNRSRSLLFADMCALCTHDFFLSLIRVCVVKHFVFFDWHDISGGPGSVKNIIALTFPNHVQFKETSDHSKVPFLMFTPIYSAGQHPTSSYLLSEFSQLLPLKFSVLFFVPLAISFWFVLIYVDFQFCFCLLTVGHHGWQAVADGVHWRHQSGVAKFCTGLNSEWMKSVQMYFSSPVFLVFLFSIWPQRLYFLTIYYVCILVLSLSVINQMTTQNVRGGGTVCISNAELWQSLMTFVSSVEQCWKLPADSMEAASLFFVWATFENDGCFFFWDRMHIFARATFQFSRVYLFLFLAALLFFFHRVVLNTTGHYSSIAISRKNDIKHIYFFAQSRFCFSFHAILTQFWTSTGEAISRILCIEIMLWRPKSFDKQILQAKTKQNNVQDHTRNSENWLTPGIDTLINIWTETSGI